MKKILHLVCNSHIDPVWQWDWDEGVAATLATFRSACDLLDKYDFVFCHNEVILYEYVEKYDPELFKRIEKHVQEGKWKIMGGWYIQPDCLVPSGESFLRQCSLGREYFGEKFGVRNTTALNFDSFGHTKGIPTILKKSGFDSYVFCRPLLVVHPMHEKDMPHGPYIWKGYDGSEITALRYEDTEANYTSQYGFAKRDIVRKSDYYKDKDVRPILWGVGNHGGTASEQDLEDILTLKKEKSGDWEIKHSSLEEYFAECDKPTVVDERQYVALMKSYSSVHPIKLAHDQLENALYLTEKVCTVAELAGKRTYNKQVLKDAERTLCQVEFHDVLSGTAIKLGTDSSIRKAHRAIENLKEEMFASFNALARHLPKVTPGDDGLVLFNPYPYDFDDYVETEFYPTNFCLDGERFKLKVYDVNGKETPHQMIHEESLIAHQKRVRIIYKAHIPAYSVALYSVHNEVIKANRPIYETENDIVVEDSLKTVRISRKTGLIESFKLGGKEYLAAPLGTPMVFDDNPDPWGWRMTSLTHQTFNENGWPLEEKANSLTPMHLDKSGKGVYKNLLGVTILEDGKLLTEVQALFTRGESHVVANYKIYHDRPYVDINYHVLWNEHQKGLKIKMPLAGSKSYFAQMAFGIEKYNDSKEWPSNRYVGVKNGENCFVIYNRSGIHSVSRVGKNLYPTLLNGSAYCAHPTRDYNPMVVDTTRFVPYVEQGVHDFSLRLQVNKIEECERFANEFNQRIYSLTYFPHGDGKALSDVIHLSNANIVVSALKRRNDGTYLIRLYNGSERKAATELSILGINKHIAFGKFEFKTFVYDDKHLKESPDASIY